MIYTYCTSCGEIRQRALTSSGTCWNCSDRRHTSIPFCLICGRKDVPGELHHIAQRKYCSWLSVNICLNCHNLITFHQVKYWPKDKSQQFYIIQGLWTILTLHHVSYSWKLDDLIHRKMPLVTWINYHKQLFIDIYNLVRMCIIALHSSYGLVAWKDCD